MPLGSTVSDTTIWTFTLGAQLTTLAYAPVGRNCQLYLGLIKGDNTSMTHDDSNMITLQATDGSNVEHPTVSNSNIRLAGERESLREQT